MDSFRLRLKTALGGILVAVFAAQPVVGDDTEIFFSTFTAAEAQPNILFIMDTSGSMRSEVVTQVAWDPDTYFDGCYNDWAVYWSTNSSLPGCGSDRFFNLTALFCDKALQNFQSTGQYIDRLLGWRGNRSRWERLRSGIRGRPVECLTDRGEHGDGSNSTDVYAVNGDEGPWTDNGETGNEPVWNRQYRMYWGRWLNWNRTGGSVVSTRIQIVKDVAKATLENIENANVGLMRFNFSQGGPILHALSDVAESRDSILSTIDSLPASGWTPLSETLYEAGLYYMGMPVDYGNVAEEGSVINQTSAPASRLPSDPDIYNQPLNFSCQKNYIVLLTDGEPTQDIDARTKIQSLPGFFNATGSTVCDGGTGNGACLDDMSAYLFNHDLDEDLSGRQNVTTYTIGFTVNLPILESTAKRGGGEYFLADDSASLTTALTSIVASILQDAVSFSAPSAPVNSFNRTQNLNDIFVSVFEPSTSKRWAGNVKKYRLADGKLVGQDGTPAVDPSTGFFADRAFSFWSDVRDGNDTRLGGAASRLPSESAREIYTFLGNRAFPIDSKIRTPANAIDFANSDLTGAMLGAPEGERARVINWAEGRDIFDEDDDGDFEDTSNIFGDPLHVRPVSLVFGGTEVDPDTKVFVATNNGSLHAIDGKTGEELWSFVPPELLDRLYDLFLNDPSPDRSFGLDGDIRAFVRDEDGVINANDGDLAYLFFGMRRGGDALYAIDVTNPISPVLMWILDSTTPGFEALGQTWSTPVLTKLAIDGAIQNDDKLVAIFGGGYDSSQDVPGYSSDTAGNALYIIDAKSGKLLWRAGAEAGADLVLPEMDNSFAAPLRVIDINNDSFADRIYASDLGGRIWRFDLFNGESAAGLVTGGVFASLGAADLDTPTLADARRFYVPPDVSLVRRKDTLLLTISIGSGYRAHPLDVEIDDFFFGIRDFNVFGQYTQDQYDEIAPITIDQLVDVTNDTQPTLALTDKGWKLAFRDVNFAGEKVLSQSQTFGNTVFFSTFTPGLSSGSACVPTQGLNRLYQISVFDGSPLTNLDGHGEDDVLTVDDRFTPLKQGSIAPEPTFLFPEDQPDKPVACVGVECFDPGFSNAPVRTFWTENDPDDG